MTKKVSYQLSPKTPSFKVYFIKQISATDLIAPNSNNIIATFLMFDFKYFLLYESIKYLTM